MNLTNKAMPTPTCINITLNSNLKSIEFDKFINSIKDDNTIVQVHKKWLPAFSEYNEIWIDIFFNSPIFEFIKDVVIYGLAWDILKTKLTYLYSKFIALDNFLNSNNQTLEVQNVKIHFDDIIINFHGIRDGATAIFSQTIHQLLKSLPLLKENDINNIRIINLPVEVNIYDNEKSYSIGSFSYPENCNPDLWIISYDYGLNNVIYNFKNNTFL